MPTRSQHVLLTATLGLFGIGCDVVPASGDTGGEEIPEAVQTAFSNSCATSGCHAGANAVAGLNLEPDQLASVIGASTSSSDLPLIDIGDLDGSYLALKMLPESARPSGVSVTGSVMPPGTANATEIALILAWIAGADLSNADVESGPPCYGPEESPMSVEFADHVWPIFDATCEVPGCHDSQSATGLALDSDPAGATAAMVGVDWNVDSGMKWIDPGSPDNSYVWHKLAGTHLEVDGGAGTTMPIGFELCSEDRLLINRWILQGAN